jgi:hypothetical protein
MPWRERKSITALLRESAAVEVSEDRRALRRSLGLWNLTSRGLRRTRIDDPGFGKCVRESRL